MKKILFLFTLVLTLLVLTGCNNETSKDDTIKPLPPTNENFFEVLDLEYNGPRLEKKYFNIDDLYTMQDGEMIGTGIAIEVTLAFNVDGDTAWFNLPEKYQSYYQSSFRFLNMDTEESTREKEEWGKPASLYTADLLDNAYSIAIQNDPGDGILDHYGRGLAWVWIKEDKNSEYELLNYKVLQQGLGSVAYLFGAGIMVHEGKTYTDWMYQAQNEAIANKRGMHSELKDPYWDYDNNTALYNLFNLKMAL